MFSNNFEITFIFQCLIIHFYLIHVRILSTNLYLNHDSVCNYTFSYRNIQVRRRIGIIFGSFVRTPFGAMPVSILQWHAEIGIFNTKLVKYPFKSKYRANVCPQNLNKFSTICCMILLLLICAGDIELNPGPRKNNTSCNFSFYHWNLNSIPAHNFSKLSLLEAYNVQHKFDMIFHKDIRHINKGKNKTIYVYFIKQKLFGYSPSSVLLN